MGIRRPFRAARARSVAAFRPEPELVTSNRPSRRQAIALLAVLFLVSAGIAVASFVVKPDHARTFHLVHGSVFLADVKAPVGVDLASGKPTLRLVGANDQVGAATASGLGLTSVHNGTLLLNKSSGEFNMVDQTGFVIKHDGGGVKLAARNDHPSAVAIASAGDSTPGAAFIERTGPVNGTDVVLVNQSNVEAASFGNKVVPRATRTMPEQALTTDGAQASANRDLWLLVGNGQQHTIRQLRLPANSRAGARLTSSDHGDINGAAAMSTAPVGDGHEAVGVASASRIQIFGPAGRHTVGFTPVEGLAADGVLPVSDAGGRLTYMLHGADGWNLVSVNADGSGLRGPNHVAGVPGNATLAPPAYSNGGIYTIDRASGRIYWIGADGQSAPVSGAVSYPLASLNGKVAETRTFGDAYVIARGTRVLIDSPSHTEAVALFTDGSRRPLTIEKTAAVSVSTEGGAEALTRNQNPSKRTTDKPGNKAKPVPSAPINNHIDCTTTSQKPHIPAFQPPTVGSRSIGLSWTYPLLDSQDCAPTTYQITVQTLTSSSPTAPSTVDIQGETAATVTGLYPSTQYEFTVTAYINGQGTSSAPIKGTTGPQGPNAPTDVTAGADGNGNWQVSWSSCGAVSQDCVPASSWQVIPSFCDGRGLSSAPTSLNVTADPSTKAQTPVTYRGSDALLGRGLQFLIEGTGASGQIGTPSARTGCIYSHSPPEATALTLSASTPPHTSLGGSASTNATLNLGANPVRALGGVGAQVTFQLTGGGGTRTSGPFTYNGAGSTISTNFDGVRAGASYTVSAVVSSPHAGGTATVTAPSISTRADWPATGLTASCPSDGATSLSCTLRVGFTGISSAAANGETFDFHGNLVCGNTGTSVDDTGFDPATHQITVSGLSQLSGYHGTCNVSGTLSEHPPLSNAVFGGTTTNPSGTSVDLGTAQAGDPSFTAKWDSSSAVVRIHSNAANPSFSKLTTNWTERVHAPDGTDCGDANAPVTPDASVTVPQSCVNAYGDKTGWRVDVNYTEVVSGSQQGRTVHFDGTPPGYQACAPQGFSATWGATIADGVQVTYGGDDTKLAGCSKFSYVLKDSSGNECGRADDVDPSNEVTVTPTAGCTPSDGWSVAISWHNNDTGKDDGLSPDLPLGSPPSQ